MLRATFVHYAGHPAFGYEGDRETIELPITISESALEILFSDCCEPIVQPRINSNDLRVLRWALVEFEHDPAWAEQLDGCVIDSFGQEVW